MNVAALSRGAAGSVRFCSFHAGFEHLGSHGWAAITEHPGADEVTNVTAIRHAAHVLARQEIWAIPVLHTAVLAGHLTALHDDWLANPGLKAGTSWNRLLTLARPHLIDGAGKALVERYASHIIRG